MGVDSRCISSSVVIKAENVRNAFNSLRMKLPDSGKFYGVSIEFCRDLPSILDSIGLEFDIVDGDVTGVCFDSGKNDPSLLIWPLLAPFVESGGKVVMEHDGEREITVFEDGDFYIIDEMEEGDEYEDEDEEEISEEAEELFDAINSGELTMDLIDKAIKSQGNLDFVDYTESTPLIALLQYHYGKREESKSPRMSDNDRELLELVISKTSNVNAVNEDGETAIALAIAAGLYSFADKLEVNGADLFLPKSENHFDLAARELNRASVDYLLDKDCDFITQGSNSLLTACLLHEYREGKLDFIKYLVEQLGADINHASEKQAYSHLGRLRSKGTPLMAAALTDDKPLVEYMLAKGANTHARDTLGNYALHYCSGQTWHSGDGDVCWFAGELNLEVVRLLANDVEQIAAVNDSGTSPYQLAREYNPEALAVFREKLSEKGRVVPIEIDEHLTGEVRYEREGRPGYVLNFAQGMLDGMQVFTHRNGGLFAEIGFKKGIADGIYRVWYDDGKLMFESNCLKGSWHGPFRSFRRNGSLETELNYVQGKHDGKQLMFDDSGEIKLEGNYMNGVRHGLFYSHTKDGKRDYHENFVDGKKERQDETVSDSPLAGMFGTIIGALGLGGIGAEMIEQRLTPSDKLFFHKQDRVFELFNKTQESLLRA